MVRSSRRRSVTRNTLAHALALYESLAAALAASIRALDARGALSAEDGELLRRHQKSLLMVLDFDSQLSRKSRADLGGTDRALDLAAARAEVARRLDRLAAAAGA